MTREQRAYFQKRAEAEIEAAQQAQHAEAVRAHYLMASSYLDLIHSPPPGQTVRLDPPRDRR